MKTWFERPACLNRVACKDCRTSREFRETIFAKQQVPEVDFACPHGVTAETIPASFRVKMRNVTVKGVPCRGCGGKVIEFRQTT